MRPRAGGGFDAVSTLVAAGFEVLRATTASPPPRPFRLGRDGMALGEGAAIVALRPSHLAPNARVHVTGFAATSDAVHLTAPDRTGRGLAFAATRALTEAGLARVDLVSPHGSATPFSDAAEAQALATALPGTARDVVIHPFKAQIGHTLGASGALEALACVDALTRGLYPAAAGEGDLDPDAHATLVDVTRAGSPRTGLKLSAAFGGGQRRAGAVARPTRFTGCAGSRGRSISASSFTWRASPLRRSSRRGSAGPSSESCGQSLSHAGSSRRWRRSSNATGRSPEQASSWASRSRRSRRTRRSSRASKGAECAWPSLASSRTPRPMPPRATQGSRSGSRGQASRWGRGCTPGSEALVVGAHLVAAGDADVMVVVAADDVGPTVSRMAGALGVEITAGAVAAVLSAERRGAAVRVAHASCGLSRAPRDVERGCRPPSAAPAPGRVHAELRRGGLARRSWDPHRVGARRL